MPDTAFYDPAVQKSWSYDPSLSASLLNAAGWKLGSDGYRHKDGQTLSISFLGSSPDRELRQEVSVYIQAYLKAVGIDMTITNYAGTSAITTEESGKYGMTATSFITASPSILFDFFRIWLRHILRNALVPAVTMLGVQLGGLLSGAVVTETVFGRQGLGSLLVSGIEAKDYPTVQAIVLIIATAYIVINIVVDLCYSLLDPRVRTELAG
jgi:ABC-type antimicrobial peptide transport system permease subunit